MGGIAKVFSGKSENTIYCMNKRSSGRKIRLIQFFGFFLLLHLATVSMSAQQNPQHEETSTGVSSGSITVSNSDGMTLVEDALYLASVSTKSNVDVQSVSGLNLNWSRLQVQCGGRDQVGLEIWWAQGTPGGDGIVTATFTQAPTNAVIAVSRYSGVNGSNPLGAFVSGNTNGENGACADGIDSNAYQFNLTTSTNNATIFVASALRNRTHTAGNGYLELVELAQGSGGSTAGLALQQKSVSSPSVTSVDGQLSGAVDWSTIGVEIKAGSAGTDAPLKALVISQTGLGTVTLTPSGGGYEAGTVVAISVAPDSGYQFIGFVGDLGGFSNPSFITMDSDKDVQVNFQELPKFTLSTVINGLGSVALNPPGGEYYIGQVVTVTATPDSGFYFGSWSGDANGPANPETVTMTTNRFVVANFPELPRYNLTVNTANRGSVALHPAGGIYYEGTTVIMTAEPDSGFSFSHWTGDVTGSNLTTTIFIDNPKTVNAKFIPQFTLDFEDDGPGDFEVTPPEMVYDSATVVTVTAIPDSDHTFAGWSGDLIGFENPTNLVMDDHKFVIGRFVDEFRLTLNTKGPGSISINPEPPDSLYGDDEPVTLTATADPGYIFSGWEGSLIGYENPATIIMDEHKHITAVFTEVPAPRYTNGIWISAEELAGISTTGPAWENLLEIADSPPGPPNVSDQDDSTNVKIMAKGLVYARTGIESYRTEVINACVAAIGTEQGGRTLALSRELFGYIIAADLVGLPPAEDAQFRSYLRDMLTEVLDGNTLVSTHEIRPNNWGTHAGATRAAIAIYLNDPFELARTATVYRGWLGDRYIYSGFSWGEGWWQADSTNPVGINPAGSLINGHNVDGVLPDDQRREGPFTWPPQHVNYVYEALQGIVAAAVVLHRAGYDSWDWEDQAILRAFEWLNNVAGYHGERDDDWQPHLINHYYGTRYPARMPTDPGKNTGWTDWTHSSQFALVVDDDNDGFVLIDPDESGYAVYDTSTVVTLTAVGNPGYVFKHWDGDLTGSQNPVSITMDGHKNVHANFVKEYQLTITVDGPGSVALDPPGGSYGDGTMVELTPIAAPGYVFSGWDGELEGHANPDTLIIDDHFSVTAKFTEIPTPLVGSGIWISQEEINLIPMAGLAWNNLISVANLPGGTPDISDQGDPVNVNVLAKALAYARTGQASYRTDVINAITAAVGTENGGESTGPGRQVAAYVIAADLVGLPEITDAAFKAWLRELLTKELGGESISSDHEERPNNRGNYAGASRAAIAAYLEDTAELARAALIFKGWLGDRSAYTDFKYGDLYWHADSTAPVGINPQGATLNGQNVDGVLADDQGDGGAFIWPPPKEGDVYKSLEGALVQAVILYRAGYDVWNWEDQALLRAYTWLHDVANFPAENEETWTPFIINYYYGSNFPFQSPAEAGRNMAWTDWTHGSSQTSQFSLSVNTVGGGGVVLDPAGGTYDAGTSVSLTAVPASGFVFAGWSEALSGFDNPAAIVMNSHKIVTATFTESTSNSYTLTMNVTGGGSVTLDPPGGTYTSGTLVTLTAVADAGTQFVGWNDGLTGNDNPATVLIQDNININAVFTDPLPQHQLTVTASSGGDVTLSPALPGNAASGLYDEGTIVLLTANPDSGYQFDGWSGDISSTDNPTTVVMDQAKSVIATFSELPPAQYTVTINGIGSGSILLDPPGGSYAPGAIISVSAIPDNGYEFSGWGGDLSGVDNPATLVVDSNKEIFGAFTERDYFILTINVTPAGAGTVVSLPAGTDFDPGTVVTLGASPNSGFLFENWSGDINLSNSTVSIVMDGDKTVTANFRDESVEQFTVATTSFGPGSIVLDPPGGTYDAGTTINVTAAPGAGFTFAGWGGDLTGTVNPTTLLIDADKTLFAAFTELTGQTYSLTTNVTPPASGTIVVNPAGSEFEAGAVISLTASPAEGFQFTGWSGDASGSNTNVSLTMDADKSITAQFEALPPEAFTVTITAIGSGTVTLTPAGNTYTAGSVVTLNAVPATGHEFNSWSGDLTGSVNPTSITVNSNMNINAIFNEIAATTYTLTIDSVGHGDVQLSPPGGVYEDGTAVSLTATAAFNYQFSHWSGDAGGTQNPVTVIMNGNKLVTANFSETPSIQYSLSTNVVGSGGIVLSPPGGLYNAGTVVTISAVPDPGYFFSGWGGDVSGVNNPTTITMDSDKTAIAAFIEESGGGGSGGPVVFEEIQSGGGSEVAAISTGIPLTGVSGHLYLAAISTRDPVDVIAVTGLGLDWSLVKAQCPAREKTNLAIWMAIGSPSGNEVVTATLAEPTENSVITVSRYSGVDASNPVGQVISGNTFGPDGPCSDGIDNTAYNFNITTSTENGVVFGAIAHRNRHNTPGAGYTEYGEYLLGSGGSVVGMSIQDQSVATPTTLPFDGTLNRKVDWVIVALEIRSGGVGGGTNQYTLNLNSAGNGSASADPTGPLYDENTAVTLTATPEPGYLFSHWSGDLTGSENPASVTMDNNKNITANFIEIPEYPVNLSIVGLGSLVKNPSQSLYQAGSIVSITAIPQEGHQFVGWGGDLVGSANPVTITVNSEINITATFTEVGAEIFTLTVDSVGSGLVQLSPSGGVYEDGTVVTLTAFPGFNYQFSHWSGDLTGPENPDTVIVDGDKQITANFSETPVIQYSLSTTAVGAGSIQLDPAGGTYDAGTIVTLMALPDAGFQLSSWSGDVSGNNNPVTLTMNGDKTVFAAFVEGGAGTGGPVTLEETIQGGATEMTQVSAGPITLQNNDLYLASIVTKNRSDVLSVSGLGLTWSRVDAQCSARSQTGIEVWMALGNPSGDGTVTAELASAPSNSIIAVSRYSGVSTSEPIGVLISGNTLGLDGGCSGGVDNNSYNFNISTSSDDAIIFGAIALRNRRHTPGAGYTEIGEFVQDGALGGDKATMALQEQSVASPSTLPFDGVFNKNVDWALIAFEIRRGGSGGGITQYTMNTNVVGGGSVHTNPSGGIHNENTVVSVFAAPDSGFEFSGWSGDLSGTDNPATVVMSSDKNITANFIDLSLEEYTLTVGSTGLGNITLDPPGGIYLEGTPVTLTAVPASGYLFSNWIGDFSSTNNPATVIMTSDKSITGIFTEIPPNQYSLNVNISGNGSVVNNPAGNVHNAGTLVTLTAIPDPGYEFSGWSGDLTGASNPASITLDANKIITASFTEIPPEEYTLTINAGSNGNVTLNPAGGTYPAGTMVELTATANAGFLFNGWSGDASGNSNPLTITMDGDKTINAGFNHGPGSDDPVTHEITISGGASFTDVVSTLTAVPAVNNELYITAIATRNPEDVIRVQGMGLTWLRVKAQCSAREKENLVVWRALGTPSGDDFVTATLADSVDNAVITVSRYSGIDPANPIGNIIGANTIGLDGFCEGGLDTDNYGYSMTTETFNSVVFGAIAHRNRRNTPGAGYTEIGEYVQDGSIGGQKIAMSLQVQDIESPTTLPFEGTFNKVVDWALVAFEIRSPSSNATPQYNLNITSIGAGGVLKNPDGGVYDENTTVTLTAVPLPGVEFTGWSGDLSGTQNPATITMTSEKNVTATFVELPPEEYAVNITAAGSGTVTKSPDAASYVAGTVITLSAAPEAGYEFTGWGGDLSGSANPLPVAVNSNMNVTATFSPIGVTTYTLTVDSVGSGAVALSPPGGVYEAGTFVTLTATAAFNYKFDNWSGDISGTTNPITIQMDANKQVTANFGETPSQQVTLTTSVSGTGNVILNPPGGVYDPGTTVTVTAIAGSVHIFSGWTGDVVDGNNPVTVLMDADKSVTANFTEVTGPLYMLTTTLFGSGIVTLDPPGGVYSEGTVVTLTAIPNGGFLFAGWAGDLSGFNTPNQITMNSDKSVIAVFTEAQEIYYTLNLTANGGGSFTANPAPSSGSVESGEYLINTTVTLSAVPDPGYVFHGWTGDLSGSENPTTIFMSQNRNVSATFIESNTQQFTLDTTIVGSGTVTLMPGGGIYDAGTVVTLTASPDENFVFDGWSGNLSGTNTTASITMDDDKSVTAAFTELVTPQYSIYPTISGGGTLVLNPPGGTYDVGTVVTMAALPDSGFAFTGWSGDLSGGANPTTLTMAVDYNITVNFTNTNSGGDGQVAYEGTVTGGATEATSVSTAQPVTAVFGDLYLAAVVTKNLTDVLSVEGMGLTWSRVKKQCSGRSMNGVDLWVALGNPAGDDIVTANLASSPSNSIIAVSRYSGVSQVSPVGTVISGNTLGNNGLCSGGVDSDSYQFNFQTTSPGAIVYSAVALRNRRHTPGATFTERGEFVQDGALGGDKATLVVQDYNVDAASLISLDGTFNKTVDWAVIGLEILPGEATKMAFPPVASAMVSQTRSEVENNSHSAQEQVTADALLKFDLTRVDAANLKSATLQVYVEGEGRGEVSLHGVSNYLRGSRASWKGNNITIENAPEIESGQALAQTTVRGSGWLVFDITEHIKSGNEYSFAIPGNTNYRVLTKQAGNDYQPQLLVEIQQARQLSNDDVDQTATPPLDLLTVTGNELLANQTGALPEILTLGSNYPDPFNAETSIEYALPEAANIRMEIFNVLGERVRVLVNGLQSAGFKQVFWDGKDDNGFGVTSGIYFLQLTVAEQRLVGKMTLQK